MAAQLSQYVDLGLRPDPEVPVHQQMETVYGQLHRALVRLPSVSVAVDFPEYSLAPRGLGRRLRLFGTADDLKELTRQTWLGGAAQAVTVGVILDVPTACRHRLLDRVQPKSNADRLRRRYAKRHNCATDEAQRVIKDGDEEMVPWPFLNLASGSTKHHYRLFLRRGAEMVTPLPGRWNTFGLSNGATRPSF